MGDIFDKDNDFFDFLGFKVMKLELLLYFCRLNVKY